MKLANTRDHMKRIHSTKKIKDLECLKKLMQKLRAQPKVKAFFKSSVGADREGSLKISYTISPNIA